MLSATNKLSLVVMAALLIAAVTMRVQRDDARTELATYRAEVATATAQAETAHRAAEKTMAQDVERLTHEHAQKEQALALRAAAAGRSVERLRNTIANLNAGASPTDPELAACTVQARTARDLLGACSAEYRSVVEDTDQLSHQVTGLQAFVAATCHRTD